MTASISIHPRTFLDYADAGFREHLLPVIPPGAAVSPDSKTLKPDKLGKTPGKLKANGWVGFGGWQNHQAEPRQIAVWDSWRDAPGCNIGLKGDLYPAIDIDVDDPALAKRLTDLAIDALGAAPSRYVLPFGADTPGSRCLLLYRGESLPSWTVTFTVNGQSHAVELKGAKHQCVMEGRHRSGGLYVWADGQSPVDWGVSQLSVVTEAHADEFRRAVETEIKAIGGAVKTISIQPPSSSRSGEATPAPSLEDVRAALVAAPNGDDIDRAEWVAVARYIKGACAHFECGGLELFLDWCEGFEGNTADSSLMLWESLSPPHHTGWRQLAMWAQERSGGAFSAAAYDFEGVERSNGTLAELVDEMFDHNVWIERQEGIYDLRSRRLRTRVMFDPCWAHLAPLWNDKKISPWQFFLREPDTPSGLTPTARRQTALDVTYRPGEPELWRSGADLYVNRWRAPTDIPDGPVTDDQVQPWLDHLRLLVPDEEERTNLTGWMASVAQRQAVKPNHGVVLGGAHGIGKSLLITPLKAAVGFENTKEISARELDAEHSDWIGQCKLFVVEEMLNFGKRELMQRLKSFLAAPPYMLQVNPKYGKKYQVPNVLAGLFFTNHEDAVAVEKGERRFLVLWSNAPKQPPEYFKRLADWYRDGGASIAARWLLEYDASDYNMLGEAPVTAAREDMRRASRSKLEEWVEDGIERAGGCFRPDLVILDDVRAQVPPDTFGRYGGPNAATFASIMRRAGARSLNERFFVGQPPPGCTPPRCDVRQARIYSLRRHEMYADLDREQIVSLYWKQRRENDGGGFCTLGDDFPGISS